jgi:antitoxin VapB
MAFSIKNDAADLLVRQLTAITGESLTAAVTESLRQRLERERIGRGSRAERMDNELDRIRELPVLNERSEQDIFGWDDIGLPT